jgi:hypothetical protein
MSGLRRRDLDAMPTFHMVELLDASEIFRRLNC